MQYGITVVIFLLHLVSDLGAIPSMRNDTETYHSNKHENTPLLASTEVEKPTSKVLPFTYCICGASTFVAFSSSLYRNPPFENEIIFLQCRHLISSLNALAAQAYHTTARTIATQSPWHGCMDELKNKISLNLQAHGSFVCLTYLFDVLSISVFTTSHWQTCGRLVHKLNVCTVYHDIMRKRSAWEDLPNPTCLVTSHNSLLSTFSLDSNPGSSERQGSAMGKSQDRSATGLSPDTRYLPDMLGKNRTNLSSSLACLKTHLTSRIQKLYTFSFEIF